MKKINLLPKWILPNSIPTSYDCVSVNVIEQTGKVYAAIRELQIYYNEFIDEVNKTITEYNEGIIGTQKEFMNHIDKIVHDYIIAIDMKIAHQDKIVADAVTYLKENLGNTITDVVREMNENGELNEYITDALNDLSEQLTTFTGTLTSHQEQIDLHEDSIGELNDKVSNLETASENHTESIKELSDNLIYTIEPRINEVDATAQQNKSDIGTLTERIATEEETRNTLGTKVQELETAIEEQNETHQTDVQSLVNTDTIHDTMLEQLNDAIYFKDQEECSIVYAMVGGATTSGSTYVGFTVPLPKLIKRDEFDVSIEVLNVRIRSHRPSAYVINGDAVQMLDTGDIDSITYNIPSVTSNLLTINLSKAAAFDVDNNVGINADIRNMKIKFTKKN